MDSYSWGQQVPLRRQADLTFLYYYSPPIPPLIVGFKTPTLVSANVLSRKKYDLSHPYMQTNSWVWMSAEVRIPINHMYQIEDGRLRETGWRGMGRQCSFFTHNLPSICGVDS